MSAKYQSTNEINVTTQLNCLLIVCGWLACIPFSGVQLVKAQREKEREAWCEEPGCMTEALAINVLKWHPER